MEGAWAWVSEHSCLDRWDMGRPPRRCEVSASVASVREVYSRGEAAIAIYLIAFSTAHPTSAQPDDHDSVRENRRV